VSAILGAEGLSAGSYGKKVSLDAAKKSALKKKIIC